MTLYHVQTMILTLNKNGSATERIVTVTPTATTTSTIHRASSFAATALSYTGLMYKHFLLT